MKKNSLIILTSIFVLLSFTNAQATLFSNTIDNGCCEHINSIASNETNDDDKKDKKPIDI